MEKNCKNCFYSRDWCCNPKKKRGYVTCVVDLTKAPPEMYGKSNCSKWKDATGK